MKRTAEYTVPCTNKVSHFTTRQAHVRKVNSLVSRDFKQQKKSAESRIALLDVQNAKVSVLSLL